MKWNSLVGFCVLTLSAFAQAQTTRPSDDVARLNRIIMSLRQQIAELREANKALEEQNTVYRSLFAGAQPPTTQPAIAIKEGMSYAQVVVVIGEPQRTTTDGDAMMCYWEQYEMREPPINPGQLRSREVSPTYDAIGAKVDRRERTLARQITVWFERETATRVVIESIR